jgi:D-alanine-D-alanine ligase
VKVAILHSVDASGPPRDPVLDQLSEALSADGHEPRFVATETDVAGIVRALSDDERPGMVFNLAESFDDRSALDASVTALLNLLHLRYTGSSPSGLMLAGDKSLTKKVLRFHGIPVPGFATMYRGAADWVDALQFPLIVKPPQEDASIGITTRSVVNDVRELLTMMDETHEEFRSPVLVEEFIDGREFYVGVLGNANAEALPVMELDFSHFPAGLPRVASWDAKWGKDEPDRGEEYRGTESIFPAGLTEKLTERLQHVALEAFQALRLRDYARVDMRARGDDVFVIEVNPNCYLERTAEFSRAAEKHGLSHRDLIGRILELASARYAR